MTAHAATPRDRQWMLAVCVATLFLWGCASARTTRPRLVLEIEPDPVIVRRLWGDIWEIPFDIHLRETAGVDVEIEQVAIRIVMGNTIVHNEVFDGADLRELGFPSRVEGGTGIHHPFRAERFIPNSRLLSNVVAHLTVVGMTDDGRRAEVSRDLGFMTAAD